MLDVAMLLQSRCFYMLIWKKEITILNTGNIQIFLFYKKEQEADYPFELSTFLFFKSLQSFSDVNKSPRAEALHRLNLYNIK